MHHRRRGRCGWRDPNDRGGRRGRRFRRRAGRRCACLIGSLLFQLLDLRLGRGALPALEGSRFPVALWDIAEPGHSHPHGSYDADGSIERDDRALDLVLAGVEEKVGGAGQVRTR